MSAQFFRILGDWLKGNLPPKTGFIILIAPFGEVGRANYMSNVDRKCAIAWMKESIARFEKQQDEGSTEF